LVEVLFVVEEFVAAKLVVVAFAITALVVVELPIIRSVIFAIVATRFEKKPLVEVIPTAERFVVDAFAIVAVPVVFVFVKVAPVAERFVVDAFIKVALATFRFVKYPLVNVNPVPEILVVDAFVKVTLPKTCNVPVAKIFPPKYESPFTESNDIGEVDPIPKFPLVTYVPPFPLGVSEIPPFKFVA